MRFYSIWNLHLCLLDKLRGVIFGLSRNAIFIGTTIHHRRGDEVSMRWWCGCCPLQRGRFPWIIGSDLLPFPDTPEEVEDERNLRQGQAPRSPRHMNAQRLHSLSVCVDGLIIKTTR